MLRVGARGRRAALPPLLPAALPADARADLARARAADANPARNPSLVGHLADAADGFVGNAGALFGEDLGLDGSDASVHRLSAALTRERRDAWAAQGAPGTAENVLFNVVVHGAAYVGACVVGRHGGVVGRAPPALGERRAPRVARGRGGPRGLPLVAQVARGRRREAPTLADRYRAHVEVPCARPEELPVFVEGERALPRLKQPRYDLLHKYLRAHLPELRDLGADFPSPERFDEFGFRWLDFHVLGGGRMVLLAGASPHGLHLFWLSAAGFEKSAFFACDAFPDPVVRPEKDRVVVMTSERGEARVHEMLWWGP